MVQPTACAHTHTYTRTYRVITWEDHYAKNNKYTRIKNLAYTKTRYINNFTHTHTYCH